MKVILAVMKQLKQLQRKPRNNSEASTFEASELFLCFLCNCFSCFVTGGITFTIVFSICSAIYYILYNIHIISLSSYNVYKLNSFFTCYQRGFIAQLVEHHTGIVEDMGSNPVEAPDFFLGFLCNCSSCFITASNNIYPL